MRLIPSYPSLISSYRKLYAGAQNIDANSSDIVRYLSNATLIVEIKCSVDVALSRIQMSDKPCHHVFSEEQCRYVPSVSVRRPRGRPTDTRWPPSMRRRRRIGGVRGNVTSLGKKVVF